MTEFLMAIAGLVLSRLAKNAEQSGNPKVAFLYGRAAKAYNEGRDLSDAELAQIDLERADANARADAAGI